VDEFPYAFKQSLPVIAAYFPLGVVFGLLFVDSGYSWYLAPLMSAFVYAGAVQFLALTMMENNASLLAILLAAFFVAFRNTFYGISFLERFKSVTGIKKGILIFGLVDGAYAILGANPKASLKFCLFVNLILYFSWVFGTFLGAFFSDWLPNMKGLDFILPAFFMVLVVDFFLKRRTWSPILFPIFISFLTYLFVPDYYLLAAIIASLIFIVSAHKKTGLFFSK
jgi:4-azaleucine resistance transporter AzlC